MQTGSRQALEAITAKFILGSIQMAHHRAKRYETKQKFGKLLYEMWLAGQTQAI